MYKQTINKELSESVRVRVKNFLDDTHASKAKFSRTVDISWGYFNNWLRGDIEISQKFTDRMTEYLDEVYKK